MLHINREQRRKRIKTAKPNSKIKKEINQIIEIQKRLNKFKQSFKHLKEGDKVKLNLDSIKSDVNYPRKNIKWKKFVDDNAGRVFTVEYDKGRKDNALVCLKEDTTDPKWLWHIADLKLAKK